MSNWHSEFDRSVCHVSAYRKDAATGPTPESQHSVEDVDIGRAVGFRRLGPHFVVLSPHSRTSFPHAESLEEEFIFVVKGSPHLWLNGYLYQLREGHAAGFPAGTGIAHTVINNTDAEVQLLVVGERTKPDNLCSFPVNPELKESCKIWWETPPVHTLGPHAGLPGPLSPPDLRENPPDCLVHCPTEPRRMPFHYPGDNETFGEGVRISDKVGLKALGIWYERLPRGTRSAFPHAHSHEEEFVFVIKGKPTFWLNGFVTTGEPGFCASFPSGTGIAHAMINQTDEEVVYICIGESQEFPGEKITYPLNDLRRRECERKGWYWHDAPKLPQGSADPGAAMCLEEHVRFRPCDASDADEVFEIFQESPTYFQLVDGCLPTLSMARDAIGGEPKTQQEKYFKEFLIIELNGLSIGVLDLHANHPEEGICYLGLLLMKEESIGKGLGRKVYGLAEDYIKRALGCTEIRLGVSAENDVGEYWKKQGYVENGKTYEFAGERKNTLVREFVKANL